MFTFSRSRSIQLWSTVGLIFLAFHVNAQSPSTPAKAQSASSSMAPAKKWETDEPMRRSMLSIRQTVASQQVRIDALQLKAEDYRQLAQIIDAALADIAKNRTLSKEATKAFQLVVQTDLAQSLDLMRSASTVELQRVGLLGVRQCLKNYGEYFQHPGWV
jgi:hypothetical protein